MKIRYQNKELFPLNFLKFKSKWSRYLSAVVIVACALGIRLLIISYTGTGAPFLLFFGAVLVSSLVGGRGPGMLAAFLGAPLGSYFFVIHAGYSLKEAFFQAMLFLVESGIVTEIIRALEKSRREAFLNARAAQRAVRARDDFVAIVAHDLKNPLSAISMRAELIIDTSNHVPEITEHATGIKSSVYHMKTLIGDILDLAKMESGKLEAHISACYTRSLVNEAFELLRPLADKKLINLTTDLNIPEIIYCDKLRILQVLLNIIGNAIKFTPNRGTIRVRVTEAHDLIKFEIEDTGPGIPEAQIPHIFDRFWQSHETHRLGTGLGLAISKGIIKAHRGEIGVKSTMGKGSVFYFIIPQKNKALRQNYSNNKIHQLKRLGI